MPQTNEFHSEEVQEIMGRIPSWIVRWGITVLFGLLLLIIWGCYLIKYPQIVTAPITLTTIPAPADLVARCDGTLDTVYIQTGESVRAGEPIALLASPTDYHDVRTLKSLLTDTESPLALANAEWLHNRYVLGDLQGTWMELTTRCRDFHDFLTTSPLEAQQTLLKAQAEQQQRYLAQLEAQGRLLNTTLEAARKTLTHDSIRLAHATLSATEYTATQQDYFARLAAKAECDAQLTSVRLEVLQTERQLAALNTQHADRVSEHEQTIMQLRQQFLAAISQWETQHVLTAPIDGTVSQQGRWSRGQQITAGTLLAHIIPTHTTKMIGQMAVPATDFARIASGQTVNVKLNGFPYMEYGILKGAVHTISTMPQQRQTATGPNTVYLVEVDFPSSMTTTYGKQLPPIPQLDGTGEIITQNMRLIERLIQPIVSLFRNR